MGNSKFRRYRFVVALALLLPFGCVGNVHAGQTQSSSSHYSVSEVQVGGNGSTQNVCSGSYCAQESVGDAAVGNAGSTSYSAQFGSDTTDIPLLEVVVDGGIQNLGVLDASTTGTATFGLKVRSYLSSGYTVYMTGPPPSQGTHTLRVPFTVNGGQDVPFTSQPGAEQFGINLADNTTPNIGSAPVQVPSGDFSFGSVLDPYGSGDEFMYKNGDAVANSLTSTGETDYTVSMILNVSNATPAGKYTGNFSAVVVPQY
jgi:hypothetical protein